MAAMIVVIHSGEILQMRMLSAQTTIMLYISSVLVGGEEASLVGEQDT
jgi:hypothetical protein